ncbi:hypothetical protein OS188_10865 [Xanthomarina sp. F1114]|nr:hypothetical protein [Xanthomarina sp. F1114]MCX7548452.1 hypothetical protein [Xanthomarina sp. F1114]
MKKNILGAIVIIFVVFASVLALKEINQTTASEVNTQQYYADSE